MRILETGNNFRRIGASPGYTLLEVMAVITLIGIMTLIVYPQFTISPEKSEIIYIGKLLKADLNLVKEEVFSSKKEILIDFKNNGYDYPIDETQISRSFLKYNFTFDVPEPEETDKEETADDTAGESFQIMAVPTEDQNDQPQEEAGDKEEAEMKPNQIKFTSNGKCNRFELSWQTNHFTGKMKIDQDGVLDWSYVQN
jgi:prepilin-type N-terminal cleavage/methylation domain-containing protein